MRLNDWDLLKLVGMYLVAHLIANTIGNNFDLMFYRKDILKEQSLKARYLKEENKILKGRLDEAVRLNKPKMIILQVNAEGDTIIKDLPEFFK